MLPEIMKLGNFSNKPISSSASSLDVGWDLLVLSFEVNCICDSCLSPSIYLVLLRCVTSGESSLIITKLIFLS